MGYTLDDMLISCYFNGIQCNTSNFNWFYSYSYGNCYTFNNPNVSSNILKTSKSGPNNGLQLELFAGIPGTQDKFNSDRGFYVAIHDNDRIPLTYFEGNKVALGSLSDISVSRTFYTRLDAPYSNCRKDLTVLPSDSTFYMLTSSITKYTQTLCYEICLQQTLIIPSCGCSDPKVFITNPSQPICITLSQLDCIAKNRNDFDTNKISDICGQYCPKECDFVVYSNSLGLANYPTDYYFSILQQQSNFLSKYTNTTLNRDLVTSTALMVNIFYKDTSYTAVTESATYTLLAIFGIVGTKMNYLKYLRNLFYFYIWFKVET